MNAEDRLTFAQTAGSPAALEKTCVEIVLGKELSAIGANYLWLHGQYRIPHEDAVQIAATPLQRALVITGVSGGINVTKNLVGDVVLFEDDETVTNNLHTGYFNYDLTDWLNMYDRRKYFITVSLGHFISNTLQVEVNPIPAPN